jgi:hypothetical protein
VLDQEVSEEARSVCKKRHCDKAPTQSERDEHRRTHLPYRSWCPECVAGRGRDAPRSPAPQEDRDVESVAYDYCFMRNAPGENYSPVLVSKDKQTKLLMAHVVPFKGAEAEWVIAQSLRDLDRLGHHGKLVLRCDAEPALVDLIREIAKGRGDKRTVVENSPTSDSQGNGFIERGVRSVEEMVRVIKLDLERRLGVKVEVSHPIFAWLVEHAVDLINKFLVSRDGKTAFERLKGKRYRGEMLAFGSPVMLRVSGKVQGGVMAERWFEGVWLGKRFHTEEHLVARVSDGVVVRTRTVQAMPNQISMEVLNKIAGAPWAPAGIMKGAEQVPRARLDPEEVVDVPEPFQPRSMRITKELIDRLGSTAKCHKCRLIMQGDTSKPTLGHSRECRERIEMRIKEDPVLNAKLNEINEKKDRYLAVEGERMMAAKGGSSSSSSNINPAEKSTEEREAKRIRGDPDVPVVAEDVDVDMGSAGEFPVPLAIPTTTTTMPTSSSSTPAQGQVRARDDEHGSAERDAVRRRVQSLVLQIHSIVDEGGDQDDEVPQDEQYWYEDLTLPGQDDFDPKLVQKAKQEEMDRFTRMKVYDVLHKSEVNPKDLISVNTRWVVTNKGTMEEPNIKARLVAQEFADKTLQGDLFAGTPNLTSVKYLISRVAPRMVGDLRC